MSNTRTVHAASVPGEDTETLAKFVNTLGPESPLREALAHMVDSLLRDKDVHIFSHPRGDSGDTT